jgi:hypothetical protein
MTNLFVGFFKMLHEDGDDHVDQYELGHQHKDDKENWRDHGGDAAVAHAVSGVVARLPQRVFHDAVPVVTSGHPEQRQEGHAKVAEVRVLAKTLARNLLTALCGGDKISHSNFEADRIFERVYLASRTVRRRGLRR